MLEFAAVIKCTYSLIFKAASTCAVHFGNRDVFVRGSGKPGHSGCALGSVNVESCGQATSPFFFFNFFSDFIFNFKD